MERTKLPGRGEKFLSKAARPSLNLLILSLALFSSLAVLEGCSGVVSGQSSPNTPPPQTFNISGAISPAAGGSGASVTLSGAANATVTTDSSGNFAFTGLANGTYTITPSHTGYTMNPNSQSVTVSGANVAGINFTAATQSGSTFSISGTINPVAGGSGATVILSGAASATTTANNTGAYTFTGLANGTYAITPSHAGYTFSPTSLPATINGANVTGVNFADTAQTFGISGTISPALGGSGATVTLSGAGNAVATSNSSGAYSFSGLANGAYTVTPSNTGYTFTPTSKSATLSGANITGLNFTAAVVLAHTATGSWMASTSTVSGYNVYRGTVSGGPYTKVNGLLIGALTYGDTTVLSGQTYFYVTTSVDASGNESVFSNEATAVIP